MTRAIWLFLLVEVSGFVLASLIHSGLLVSGYQHRQASIAESSIAVVLMVGLILSLVLPGRTRLIGLVVQAVALLGTLVGVGTIAIGIGPRTSPDIAFHVAILVVLSGGLFVTARAPGVSRLPA